VHEAVVVVLDSETGKRLVAYIVIEDDATFDDDMVGEASERGKAEASSVEPLPHRLQDYLSERLPDHMIPSAFVSLEAMPLTPNGKIDRRALPAPTFLSQTTYVAPQNEVERQIVALWQEVLQVDKACPELRLRIGITDDFFELGGHSLLATQLIFRLRSAFQVDFPLRKLFEAPTVEGVVEALAQLWGGREIVEEIARTWQEVAELSEEETKRMIQES
jgi:acyl carrier protein